MTCVANLLQTLDVLFYESTMALSGEEDFSLSCGIGKMKMSECLYCVSKRCYPGRADR